MSPGFRMLVSSGYWLMTDPSLWFSSLSRRWLLPRTQGLMGHADSHTWFKRQLPMGPSSWVTSALLVLTEGITPTATWQQPRKHGLPGARHPSLCAESCDSLTWEPKRPSHLLLQPQWARDFRCSSSVVLSGDGCTRKKETSKRINWCLEVEGRAPPISHC